jgi:hypothetical protein
MDGVDEFYMQRDELTYPSELGPTSQFPVTPLAGIGTVKISFAKDECIVSVCAERNWIEREVSNGLERLHLR